MSKTSHSRNIGLLVLALLLTAAVANAAEEVTIVHFSLPGHGAAWATYLEDRAKAFEELYPDINVEIEVAAGSGGNYTNAFLTRLAGGTPPNVTDFHAALAGKLITEDVFTDLGPYLERDGISLQDLTVPSVIDSVTAPDGSVWSLPGDIYPVVTFYNQDLFDDAGLADPILLGDDWTWERALESARLLTQDRTGDGMPDQWGIERMGFRWYMWIHQAGGELYDRLIDPAESRWNTPPVVEGLSFPLAAYQAGVTPARDSSGYAQINLASGIVGMSFVDGPGVIAARLTDVSFRWNTAPQVRGPKNAGSEVAVAGFQMVADAPHKEETWLWLKFISLHPDSMLKLMEITGRLPHMVGAITDYERFNPHAPTNWRAFLDVAVLPETKPNYVLTVSEVNRVVESTLVEVFTERLPLETAVELLHEQVSAMLRQSTQ